MPAGSTRQSEVWRSSRRTATVVTASRSVVLRPSGRMALPYWNRRHRPGILPPLPQTAPLNAIAAAVQPYVPVRVRRAGLDHGGEENCFSGSAPVNRGTAQRREFGESSLSIEPVDVIGFKRSVGRKIQCVRRRHQGYGARLLMAGENRLHLPEIAGHAQNAALGAIVPGEHPETVGPLVVDDVVNMSHRAARKGVGDVPRGPAIGGGVNVHLVTLRIVEVLAPENMIVRRRGKVQRTRPAQHPVGHPKFTSAQETA